MADYGVRATSAAALLILLTSGAGANYLNQTIDTTSLAFGEYDPINDGAGPYPFSNFGVQASAGLGADFAASVSGNTVFSFPSVTGGQTFTANASALKYAYTPSWSGGSVGAHAGLSASANFVYNIGPFSGNYSIFDIGVNSKASGAISGGTRLTGGTANGFSAGPSHDFGMTESALFASASAGVTVGVNLANSVSYTPTIQYGYYSWVNTNGGLNSSDTLTWHGVSSGALSYLFPSNLAVGAGSEDFFLNFLPGVQMQMPITPTTTITIPLTGFFNVSAFGDTLVNETLSLGNLYSLTENYDTWNDDVNWNGAGFYSLNLHEDNSACQTHPGPSCEVYDVMSHDPLFATQVALPPNTTQNFSGGGGNGGWNPGVQDAPLVPDACDPSTGICYASNDPNMPTGPGTVTITNSEVPEPGTLMIFGFGFLGLARRLRGSTSAMRSRPCYDLGHWNHKPSRHEQNPDICSLAAQAWFSKVLNANTHAPVRGRAR